MSALPEHLHGAWEAVVYNRRTSSGARICLDCGMIGDEYEIAQRDYSCGADDCICENCNADRELDYGFQD